MKEFLKKYKLTHAGLEIYEKYKAILLYLFFGGVTTILNIGIYALFTKVFCIEYMTSNIIAWVVAISVAYITNKIYVFESKSTTKVGLVKEIFFFLLARLLSLVLDIIIMYIGVSILAINDIFIKILANACVIIANYFMSKFWIFNQKSKNMESEKPTVTFLQYIKYYCITIVGMILVFSICMMITYMLPNGRIKNNVKEAFATIEKEGEYFSPFYQENSGTMLDNFTDSMMLNMSLDLSRNKQPSVLKRTYANDHYYKYFDVNNSEIYNLKEALNTNPEENIVEYSRYWNGIQVVLRPLLIFFNYTQIRYINAIFIFSLVFITLFMIGRLINKRTMFAFSIAIILINFFIIPMSLQFSSVFIISLLGIIVSMIVFRSKKREIYLPILFLIIGGVTTFFDMLTYPLITLGFPLLVVMMLYNKYEKLTIFQQIIKIVLLSASWCIGYIVLFISKWILASIVLEKNVVSSAIKQMFFRVNGNESVKVDRFSVISKNFDIYFNSIVIGLFLLFTIIWTIMMIFFKKNRQENYRFIAGNFCITLFPFIWIFIFANHSSIHSFFVYRIMAIAMFSIVATMLNLIDVEKIKKLNMFKKIIKIELGEN